MRYTPKSSRAVTILGVIARNGGQATPMGAIRALLNGTGLPTRGPGGGYVIHTDHLARMEAL